MTMLILTCSGLICILLPEKKLQTVVKLPVPFPPVYPENKCVELRWWSEGETHLERWWWRGPEAEEEEPGSLCVCVCERANFLDTGLPPLRVKPAQRLSGCVYRELLLLHSCKTSFSAHLTEDEHKLLEPLNSSAHWKISAGDPFNDGYIPFRFTSSKFMMFAGKIFIGKFMHFVLSFFCQNWA